MPLLSSHLFFLALSYYHHDPSLPLATGSSHSLDQSHGRLVSIETDDEIHLTDIQTLLTNTGSY